MSTRLCLTLVCVVTLTGCGTSTAPTPATPKTAAPAAPPALPASVGNDNASVVTLLGKPVLASDCLSPSNGIGSVEVGLHSLVLSVLMEDFCDPQSLTLSPAEIDAFWQRMQAVAGSGGKGPTPTPPFDEAKAQARLEDVRQKLAAPNLAWLERLTLQGQERGSVQALEQKSVPATLAYENLLPLRCTEALYKKYGGKVVAMQISVEPVEAMLKLVQEAEASGKLVFHDEGLKQAFWKRMNEFLAYPELPPERVDFSLPAWLQMAVPGPAAAPIASPPAASTPSASLDFDRWFSILTSTRTVGSTTILSTIRP